VRRWALNLLCVFYLLVFLFSAALWICSRQHRRVMSLNLERKYPAKTRGQYVESQLTINRYLHIWMGCGNLSLAYIRHHIVFHPTGPTIAGIYYRGETKRGWKWGPFPPRPVHMGQPQPPRWWNRLGFWIEPWSSAWEDPDVSRHDRMIQIGLPLWFAMMASGILPAWRFGGWWKRRRRRRIGRCPACGYDLCATPERCPECGAEAPRLVREDEPIHHAADQ
jgi:hypothetical protein